MQTLVGLQIAKLRLDNACELPEANRAFPSHGPLPPCLSSRLCMLEGLGVHRVVTEEDAMRLLYTGDLNKILSETPMNRASSRSHCIFTIHFKGRDVGANTWVRSKFNIVDLAGSERLKKTNSAGQLLTETKFINGSLFHLQNVVAALSESNAQCSFQIGVSDLGQIQRK